MGCFLIPFAGFIGGTYVFLVTSLAIVLTKFKFWKEAITGMAGTVFGMIGVGLFFLAFGRLQAFRESLGHLTAGEWHPQFKIFLYPTDDLGVAVMIALLGVISFYYWQHPAQVLLPG